MFTPTIRLLLVVLLFIVGGHQLYEGNRSGWLLLFSALAFGYGYFRYGTVWAAWQAAKQGDLDKAESLISTIRYPQLLSAQFTAYHHYILGLIEARGERWDEAVSHLRSAAAGALRTTNDRAAALLTLAEILAVSGDMAAARESLQEARNTPHKEALQESFDRVEAVVGDAG